MAAQPRPRFSPTEYLALERQAEYKSEYLNGEIFAMAGASEAHILIVGNVMVALHPQLRKRSCRIYSNDMRVKVSDSGLYTYPDIVIVCDQRRFDDNEKDTLLNPTIIIEVLSPSTSAYDRGAKFAHYRKLDSLSEYIMIAQDQYHIEHFVRQPNDQWLFSEATKLEDTILLPSVGCQLALADVYDEVDISPAEPRS
jgi:Uma2 family endonuclease